MTDHPPKIQEMRTRDLIRRLLLENAGAHWKLYVVALAMMAVAAGATALTAYLIGDVINQAYVNRNFSAVLSLGLFTLVLFTLKGAATYGQAVTLSRVGNRIVADNQRKLFGKLLHENLGFFADRHTTEFTARMASGATAVTQVMNLLITAIGRDALSLVALATVMVLQDPMLSLLGLLTAPPALIFLRKLIKRIRDIARQQFHGSARTMETMQETLQGIRIVKAFNLEDTMQKRFDENVASVEHEANKMARVANRSSPLMETLGGFAIAGALIYGGYRVIETGATPGQFFSFFTAFLLAYEPAKRLARLNIELNAALTGTRILLEVIDTPPGEPDDQNKPDLAANNARIEFSDVAFGYRSEGSVLRGMSFVADTGKMTALVGPSGGGKSTVFNLLMRFYEPERGTISINGQNIVDVSRASLRRQIAYVGQDVFLFRGSIRDNIGFGKPNATEAEIIAAAKAAHAHEFVSAFPQGYDTPVGEHGLQLSGGQRQRVAIARALIKDAPLILLDEATAALDSESERLVRDAIDHLCQGRTTLVIAHRLSTVSHADRILVVESGKIVESGRHDELVRLDGRYASFHRLQLQADVGETEPAVAAAR